MAKHGTEFETFIFLESFLEFQIIQGKKMFLFFSWREVNVVKKTKETLLLLRNKGRSLIKQGTSVSSDFQNVGEE